MLESTQDYLQILAMFFIVVCIIAFVVHMLNLVIISKNVRTEAEYYGAIKKEKKK